jgi:hypothetical protein
MGHNPTNVTQPNPRLTYQWLFCHLIALGIERRQYRNPRDMAISCFDYSTGRQAKSLPQGRLFNQ